MGLETVEFVMATEATFVTALAIQALELARAVDHALYAHEQVRGLTGRSGLPSREGSA